MIVTYNILKEKSDVIIRSNHINASEIITLTEKLTELENKMKEINEAITVGEKARIALDKLINSLNSARNWGTYDVLGGGLLATSIKHSRLDDANDISDEVNYYLEKFRHELTDVNINCDIRVELSEFSRFADYFFDGFFADMFVQSKIKASHNSSIDMYNKVIDILQRLENTLISIETEYKDLDNKRTQLIEKT